MELASKKTHTKSLVCLLSILGAFISSSALAQQQYVVSLSGDDSNPGTQAQPFRTLEGARDAIRTLKSTSGLPAGGVNVLIRGGIYERAQSFSLDAQDSGVAGKSITYQAWPNEEVTLLSGKNIPSSSWTPLSADAIPRVNPNVSPSLLVQLDYSNLGVQNSEYLSATTMSSGATSFSLFAGGKRQTLSQWPNIDYGERWVTPNGTRDNYSFYFGDGASSSFSGERANLLDLNGSNRSARWKARIEAGYNIWLRGHWRTGWSPKLSLVDEVNTDGNWISLTEVPSGGMGSKYSRTFTAYDGNTYRRGNGQETYYALNMLEEIDQPGEYSINFKDKKVYFYPSSNIANLTTSIMDSFDSHIVMNDVEHISFKRLTVRGGLGNGFIATDSSHVTVEGCYFDSVGKIGIKIIRGDHYLIKSNDILYPGASGISMILNSSSVTTTPSDFVTKPSNCVITNNHVGHTGQLAFGAPGVHVSGVGMTLSHNLIHHTSTAGLGHGGQNNLYEYNEIHNTALKTSDTGATYTYGDWSSYGNVLRYNFIHHNTRSNGFYCDNSDSGDVHYKNIIHNCQDALKFGGGHDNIADNNLLILNKQQRIDDRGRGSWGITSSFGRTLTSKNTTEEPWLSYGAQLMNDPTLGYTSDLWTDHLDASIPGTHPDGSRYKDNVTVESNGWRLPSFSRSRSKIIYEGNQELGSVAAAGFSNFAEMDLTTTNQTILDTFGVDADGRDYNAQFNLMGLIIDDYRTNVPTRKEVGGLVNNGSDAQAGEEQDISKRININYEDAVYQYDFGTDDSSVADGWEKIHSANVVSIFWTGEAVSSQELGMTDTVTDLQSDSVRGSGKKRSVLNHVVANGLWRLEMVMGSKNTNHWGLRVKAEGEYIAYNMTTSTGQFKYLNGRAGSATPAYVDVLVTDGLLNLEFYANASRHWAVNSLKMTRITTERKVDLAQERFKYDFGATGGETEEGWKVISPLDYGDISWSGGSVTTVDEGATDTINNLNRDYVEGRQVTQFNHKIKNGTWRVAIVTGKQSNGQYGMRFWAEGVRYGYNIATAAGQYKYVNSSGGSESLSYFDVEVTDGELNLEMRVNSGISRWNMTHMTLTLVGHKVDLAATLYRYDFGSFDSNSLQTWSVIPNDSSGDISWSGGAVANGVREDSTSDLNRDFVTGSSSTQWNHKIANGVWEVALVMGDQDNALSGINVSAEGNAVVTGLSTAAGEFKYVDSAGGSTTASNFQVTVSDGELNLEISGGSWNMNNLVLTKVGASQYVVDLNQTQYKYDFGPIRSKTLDGWQVIAPVETGDIILHGSAIIGNEIDQGNRYLSINEKAIILNDLDSLDGKNQLSMSLWVRGVGSGYDGVFMSRNLSLNGGAGSNWGFGYNGNRIDFRVNNHQVSTYYTVSADWNHYVLTWDGATGTSKSYINGVLRATVQNDADIGSITNMGAFSLGTDPGNASSRLFSGGVDDIRMYDRVLTDSEIGTSYNNLPHMPLYHLDFETTGSATYGSVSDYDAGRSVLIDNLDKDGVYASGGGTYNFNHKIKNGKWRVDVTAGRKNASVASMSLAVEGESFGGNIQTNASEFKTLSHEVVVIDGELNLQMQANSGIGLWSVTQLVLTNIDAQFDWTLDADGNGQKDGIDYFLGSTQTNSVILPPVTRNADGSFNWEIPYDPTAVVDWVIETSTDLELWRQYDASDSSGVIQVNSASSRILMNMPSNLVTEPNVFFRLGLSSDK